MTHHGLDSSAHRAQVKRGSGGESVADPARFAASTDVGVGKGDQSLSFNGTTSRVELDRALRLPETGDFTFTAWICTDGAAGWPVGDIFSQYDPSAPRRDRARVYQQHRRVVEQANQRQLSFYLSDGAAPRWRSAGRPQNCRIVFSFVTHGDKLLAAANDPTAGGLGRLFEYQAPDQWLDRGAAPDGTNSVRSLVVHAGALYATTGCDDGTGSILPSALNTKAGGRVYRIDDQFHWHDCGTPFDRPVPNQSLQLFSFGGELYLSSLFHRHLYVHEGGQSWREVPTPPIAPGALGMYRGALYTAPKLLKPKTYPELALPIKDGDPLYRLEQDGSWRGCFSIPGANLSSSARSIRIYTVAIHANQLFAGSWSEGRVHRSTGGAGDWLDAGDVGRGPLPGHDKTCGEVMAMSNYHGELYIGTLPHGEVYRYDGDGHWTRLHKLDHTPDIPLRRVWASIEHDGGLFFSTMPSGEVWRMDCGVGVTAPDPLPTGWRHVAAVRRGDELALYVDGQCVASLRDQVVRTIAASSESPLTLGAGRYHTLRGTLRDVRLYRRALDHHEIASIPSSS